MAQILAIGVATLDIINLVDHYPLEDEKMRALSSSMQRGGNAANTLVVLSQLGQQCSFAGVLSNSATANVIFEDLQQYHINTQHCVVAESGTTPTSYITLNQKTGSRTIIHHRDLREFTYTDFAKINLEQYDWIHFEGREVAETLKMMQQAKQQYPQKPLSVEIEKPRANIETLIDPADTVFFSQTYATAKGFETAHPFINNMAENYNNKTLICNWGSEHTVAIEHQGKLTSCATFAPATIVDTVAAGDTFIAGFIDAALNQQSLQHALEQANRLAGRKCGQPGLQNLGPQNLDPQNPGHH